MLLFLRYNLTGPVANPTRPLLPGFLHNTVSLHSLPSITSVLIESVSLESAAVASVAYTHSATAGI